MFKITALEAQRQEIEGMVSRNRILGVSTDALYKSLSTLDTEIFKLKKKEANHASIHS